MSELIDGTDYYVRLKGTGYDDKWHHAYYRFSVERPNTPFGIGGLGLFGVEDIDEVKRIPTPAELALQADELARRERENAALREAVQHSVACVAEIAKCRQCDSCAMNADSLADYLRAALLAPPTVAALVAKLTEDLQQEFARNAGEPDGEWIDCCYRCDPALISLDHHRFDGLPVRRVAENWFREPVKGELIRNLTNDIQRVECDWRDSIFNAPGWDQRRLIVETYTKETTNAL